MLFTAVTALSRVPLLPAFLTTNQQGGKGGAGGKGGRGGYVIRTGIDPATGVQRAYRQKLPNGKKGPNGSPGVQGLDGQSGNFLLCVCVCVCVCCSGHPNFCHRLNVRLTVCRSSWENWGFRL